MPQDYGELSALLVDAKMAAAEYAFERDELRQQCKRLKEEIDRISGGGRKVRKKVVREG